MCSDLQVLGQKDFKNLLKWRSKIRKIIKATETKIEEYEDEDKEEKKEDKKEDKQGPKQEEKKEDKKEDKEWPKREDKVSDPQEVTLPVDGAYLHSSTFLVVCVYMEVHEKECKTLKRTSRNLRSVG